MAKLGCHIVQGPRQGYGELATAKPAVCLLVDQDPLETEQKSGGYTVTIFRADSVYGEAPPGYTNHPDPAALARQWYPALREKWLLNKADYYQCTNEQGGGEGPDVEGNLLHLIAFEREIMRLANLDGLKVCVLNLAGGSPGDIDLWKRVCMPFVIEAWQGKNVYGRHAYGSGDLVDATGNVIPGNPARPFIELGLLRQAGAAGGIVITEAGIDGGFGFAGVDRFTAQLTGYERLLRQYPEFVGCCAWTLGNWSEANWQAAIPTITSYLNANPTPAWTWPATQPPPIDPPPATGLNAYLWNESNAYAQLHGINYNPALGLWKQILADGYSPVHTEIPRNYEGKGYAIQQAFKQGQPQRLYVYAAGQPIYFIVDGQTPPPVEPPPAVDRPVGIDVSHHQGAMNWPKAKAAGAWYAFIKATQRTNWTDPRFLINWQEAKAAGLLVAPYHYFQPGYDPVAQAEYFVNTVQAAGVASDLPYALDVEEGGSTAGFSDMVKACLNRIKQLTGRKPILYCGIYYANNYLKTVTPADADLWIANWVNKPDPNMPTAWNYWHFWQYTSSGNGLQYGAQSARIDLNKWNGTLATLYQYAGNALPPPIDPPPGNKIDLLPYFLGNAPKGVLYEVQTEGAGQQRHQTQIEGNVFYHTKDNEWEQLKYDSGFIYRGIDTSPGGGQFYRLGDIGNPSWSKWAARYMAVGEVFERKPTITFCRKSDCGVLSVQTAVNYLRLNTVYPSFTFFTGIKLDKVIELDWLNTPGGSFVERYYYAVGYGLVGWNSSDGRWAAISEIHAPGARPNNVKETGCYG